MSDRSHLRDVLVMGASVMALAGLAAPALAQTRRRRLRRRQPRRPKRPPMWAAAT